LHLQCNRSIIIIHCDKELGSVEQLLLDYMKDAIDNYLGDHQLYACMTKIEANVAATQIKREIESWIYRFGHSLDKNTKAFL
jgi:hypothetical protein